MSKDSHNIKPLLTISDGSAENVFDRQLTPAEIDANLHREFIGGMWDEMGPRQFNFLVSAGLAPHHRMIDIGCGCLRAGIHFVPYLGNGNYFGIDINASLIEAGKRELVRKGIALHEKRPNLQVNSQFKMTQFGVKFDFALAQSVFTHLYVNHIGRCLVEVGKVLAPDGKFFATFFQAPTPMHIEPLDKGPAGLTYFDKDPFHYSMAEMEMLAKFAGLSVKLIGEWGHPRNQQMLCFSQQ
ncbi:MAG TPA: class I SAM-dependent methyltransferase [Verrucomicrobiae bacterium]|jgi:SAM-dependent methyltransferase